MFTTISKSFWFQFVPATIFGVATIFLLLLDIISPYYLVSTLIMWTLVSGLGVAVGYHRVFSHRTHHLPVWKEVVLLFLGSLAAQGASIFWVALHRGYHHPFSDQHNDLHSPTTKGVFQSFVGWQMKVTERQNPVNIKYAVDLLRKPHHVWFHKHQLKILWGVPLVVSLVDWKLALTGFCLVSFLGMLQDNIVNVLGHLKHIGSYRNFTTNDNSQNSLILGYTTWGQGWHNNHHHDPKSFDFGTGISGKWWEFDPCKLFLWFLK